MQASQIAAARGGAGENAVCQYLTDRGYKIIKRNYRIKGGEIDIISQKSNYIVFTEVKSRKFGTASKGYEAMTKAKMRRIIKTANLFISQNPRYKEYYSRFDTAYITLTTDKFPQVLNTEYYEGDFTAADIE